MYVGSIMFQSILVHLFDYKFRFCCKAYPQIKVFSYQYILNILEVHQNLRMLKLSMNANKSDKSTMVVTGCNSFP